MTVYVVRDGKVVPKSSIGAAAADRRSVFPSPRVSRMEPFESPITGKEITSWRERDADMKAVGAVDPRDLAPGSRMKRGRQAQKREADAQRSGDTRDDTFKWGSDPGAGAPAKPA